MTEGNWSHVGDRTDHCCCCISKALSFSLRCCSAASSSLLLLSSSSCCSLFCLSSRRRWSSLSFACFWHSNSSFCFLSCSSLKEVRGWRTGDRGELRLTPSTLFTSRFGGYRREAKREKRKCLTFTILLDQQHQILSNLAHVLRRQAFWNFSWTFCCKTSCVCSHIHMNGHWSALTLT